MNLPEEQEIRPKMRILAKKGIINLHYQGFNWVDDFLNSLQIKSPVSIKTLSSIEEVRKLYEATKKKSD